MINGAESTRSTCSLQVIGFKINIQQLVRQFGGCCTDLHYIHLNVLISKNLMWKN